MISPEFSPFIPSGIEVSSHSNGFVSSISIVPSLKPLAPSAAVSFSNSKRLLSTFGALSPAPLALLS